MINPIQTNNKTFAYYKDTSALSSVQDREDIDSLQRSLAEILEKEHTEVPKQDLLKLQSLALDTLQSLFKNEYGQDSQLKEQVSILQSEYQRYKNDPSINEGLLDERNTIERQAIALKLLLRTFIDRGPKDTAFREILLEKLGDIGGHDDLDVVLPYVRKGNAKDLENGLNCIHKITARIGPLPNHLGLKGHPFAPFVIKKSPLSAFERRAVIEAVLKQGEITHIKKSSGSNVNSVYFVTFKETLPGPGGSREPIRGVFKPEFAGISKERAFFSREVAAYEVDKLAGVNLVTPTVETILEIPDDESPGSRIGSLQYMIPNSIPLGLEENPRKINPEFKTFIQSEIAQKRLDEIRTLQYILGDIDHYANTAHDEKSFIYSNYSAHSNPKN